MPESITMLAPSHWQASGKICSLAVAASCVRQHHQSMLSLFAVSESSCHHYKTSLKWGAHEKFAIGR
jgi:hypothetical protein